MIKDLKALLLKYDTIKTLDQAADRLDARARDQNELRIEAMALSEETKSGRGRGRGAVTPNEEQADNQGDLNRDLQALFQQLDKLPPFLSPEQKQRLADSKANVRGKQIQDVQTLAARLLGQNEPSRRGDQSGEGRGETARIGRLVALPRDRLETLKEAACQDRQGRTGAGKSSPRKRLLLRPRDAARPVRRFEDQAARHARDMAQKEARVEFDAKQAHELIKDIAKEAADKVKEAENSLQQAQDELNNNRRASDTARDRQEKAIDELKSARDKLDDLIAKEEKKKSDPLEAVKDAIAKVDKLIKDETKNREKTEATKGTQTEKMPALPKSRSRSPRTPTS